MNVFLTVAVLTVCGFACVLADCNSKVTECSTAYKTATAKILPNDKQTKCDALILEFECLRVTEITCKGKDKTAINNTIYTEILPVLIQDCPGELCKADISGCNNQWKANQTQDASNQPMKCRAAAKFEACLNGIASACTPVLKAQIRQTLDQLRPQINKVCKNEDCKVQGEQCVASWKELEPKVKGNKAVVCQLDEGLQVCLEGIEAECSPIQRKEINDQIALIKPQITANCQGLGCTPKLIQCNSNWNSSIAAAPKEVNAMCSADKAYESCLKATKSLCDPDEQKELQQVLTLVGPKVAQHCGAGNDIRPLSFTIVLVAGALLLKRLM